MCTQAPLGWMTHTKQALHVSLSHLFPHALFTLDLPQSRNLHKNTCILVRFISFMCLCQYCCCCSPSCLILWSRYDERKQEQRCWLSLLKQIHSKFNADESLSPLPAWLVMPQCIPHSLNVVSLTYILINRIWQRWWNVTFFISLYIMTPHKQTERKNLLLALKKQMAMSLNYI